VFEFLSTRSRQEQLAMQDESKKRDRSATLGA